MWFVGYFEIKNTWINSYQLCLKFKLSIWIPASPQKTDEKQIQKSKQCHRIIDFYDKTKS